MVGLAALTLPRIFVFCCIPVSTGTTPSSRKRRDQKQRRELFFQVIARKGPTRAGPGTSTVHDRRGCRGFRSSGYR